jgi:transmembrane 9 superfamily protein 3
VHADEKTHRYVAGEEVTLWTNKVGPYNNPQETFNYYTLPFCKSGRGAIERKFGSLGNVLMGNELAKSTLHHFKFLEDMPKTSYCEQTMTKQDIVKLVYAIQQNYWFEMYVDDLPLWGFIGKYEQQQSGKYEVNMYTHQKFVIGHNGDRIIFVHLTMMEPQALDPTVEEEKITFTYEVSYEDSTKSFHRRYEQYLDFNFFQHKIHWFSVFNSFMMVIFLVGLVSMILLRTLRKDYARYAKEDELDSLERDLNDEYGWKLVHGDVFRPPQYLMWLSAVYGIGIQFCVQCVVVVITVICGSLFMESGAVLNTVILSGALISFVGGYFSGSFYAQNDGKNWIKTMILSTAFFPGVCFLILAVLNTIAWVHNSMIAIPFFYVCMLLVLFFFVTFPLSLAGTIVGRNWNGVPNYPCRIKRIPSPVPYRKWYLTPAAISILGGLLPFGSIFIEMYFLFTSLWNYKVYYVYGFMLLVFLILMIVTSCVSIVGTYFLLNAENYHWHWTSFLSSASTALYVFLYSIHFYLFKTKMTGLYQAFFYYGYTSIFCFALALMCGSIGYASSHIFVRIIYKNIKCD